MPTDKINWTWEEAFQTYGFNGGDNPQHSDSVGEFLVSLGWHYELASTHHNSHINEIWKGDNRDKEWIQFEGQEGDNQIRDMLPEDVVAALDKEFPSDTELPKDSDKRKFIVTAYDKVKANLPDSNMIKSILDDAITGDTADVEVSGKVWIGVEVYQLIVTDVHVFTNETESEKWFEKYTGLPYASYKKALEEGNDSILDENYDQTKLFGVELDA
jgi:hypothetical protein